MMRIIHSFCLCSFLTSSIVFLLWNRVFGARTPSVTLTYNTRTRRKSTSVWWNVKCVWIVSCDVTREQEKIAERDWFGNTDHSDIWTDGTDTHSMTFKSGIRLCVVIPECAKRRRKKVANSVVSCVQQENQPANENCHRKLSAFELVW